MRSRLMLTSLLVLAAGCTSMPEAPPAAAAPATAAHTAAAPLPVPQLAPLAHWVGGRWVGTFEAGGRKVTLTRLYAWSFDRRLIIGKSLGERDGKTVQSRETVFFWNPETKRVEFIDFLDASGGYGHGWLESRDGQIYMDVKVIGNAGHPSWRAWIKEATDQQVIRVEALREGKWVDFGTSAYQRQ